MKLRYFPFTIVLKDTFTISHSSRSTTPAMMVEIEHDGLTGYGEASLPPYLKENQQSVTEFFKKVDLSEFNDPLDLDIILDYINNLASGNEAAKAAIDLAVHDLAGKIKNLPLNQLLNFKKSSGIYTSFTIGISSKEKIKMKISVASSYKYLKIKLGSEVDKKNIEFINSLTDKPLFVDVNQGWSDKYSALEMINWLAEKNVVLVEQPLSKEMIKENGWLTERSPLPIIADEAIQTFDDIELVKDFYSGINIKLMKCGGVRQAKLMIEKAKRLNLKIMIGCMTETSCAVTAASHLASLADWIDLDGAELISNDPFSGMKIIEGMIQIPDSPGLGVTKIRKYQT